MTYLILDYAPVGKQQAAMEEKSGRMRTFLRKYQKKYNQKASAGAAAPHGMKLFKLLEQFQKNKQLQQLSIEKHLSFCKELQQDFMYIMVRAIPKELQELPQEGVQDRIEEAISEENVCILQAEPDLYPYLPKGISWTDEAEEVYINLLRHSIAVQLAEGRVEKKNARLAFLVDHPSDAIAYIDSLSRGFNYVSVCAKQHDELEGLYERLYEEEGLMVQALPWDVHQRMVGDVAVDLTNSPKGLHRLYPEKAPVLDLSISHEKERMLAGRGGNLNYIQILKRQKCSSSAE